MKILENNLKVPIDKIKPNKYNPKPDYNESEELKVEFGKIKNSLKVHGQVDPLQVREVEDYYELVNGYHRLKAMQELGFKEAEVKNFGKISEEEAIKIALSMEELRIPLDIIETAKLIKRIKESETGLEGLPYLEEEIKQKIELLEFDWSQFEGERDTLAPDVRTLSIVVTEEQREVIMRAIKKVMDEDGVKEGRALEIICGDFLAGPYPK